MEVDKILDSGEGVVEVVEANLEEGVVESEEEEETESEAEIEAEIEAQVTTTRAGRLVKKPRYLERY
jgi:hypothetical protein